MMGRSVFPSQAAQDAWREHWCGRCFQPDEALRRLFKHGDGCPILAAAQQGTVPPQWKRGRGTDAELYRCNEYQHEPAVVQLQKEKPLPQQALFAEPEHQNKRLIEVDGWPDHWAFARRTR